MAGWRDNPWTRFVARRAVRLLVSLAVLVSSAFALIHLIPGDPVRAALGVTAPADLVAARRAQLGLDRPLYEQFWAYVSGLFRGDLGVSSATGLPVADVIGQRLPDTLALAGAAFVVILLVAVPLGVAMAVLTRGGRRRGAELAFTGATGVLVAVPEFLLAVGLVFAFAVTWPVLPVAGNAGAAAYLLPVAALAVAPAAALARVIRVEGLAVLGQDYVRTARAKRLPARLIYLRHALPNMLTAGLTIAGMMLTGMIAGTVLVETIFAWPGLGTAFVDAITQKDYSLAQGIVLVYGAAVLLVNFLVDLVLSKADPRSTIREG
ncbi:peptide ABC transporter permease [Phytohabitans rumicis]|uniref:Peptide ABC transporter permease n=1 Tax=Phytohabitans rumicis TaxID=1076125 RepID=A0A6V8LU66_9ACTN|nr:peptide ABC transporter permease [Phytohabitans rumicis]